MLRRHQKLMRLEWGSDDDERKSRNKAHSAMYSSVGVLAGDDGVARLDQQLHALVDAVLSAVGDQDVARYLRWTVRLRLERAQL